MIGIMLAVAGAVIASAGACTALTTFNALGDRVRSAAAACTILTAAVVSTFALIATGGVLFMRTLACAAAAAALVLETRLALPFPHPPAAVAVTVPGLHLIGVHSLLHTAHLLLILYRCSRYVLFSLWPAADTALGLAHTSFGVILFIVVTICYASLHAFAAVRTSFGIRHCYVGSGLLLTTPITRGN